jgi:hypothetical protein
MPVRKAIGYYIKALMPLAPIRETEKKDFFRSRCFPAPAAPGSSKKPGYVEAVSLSACDAGCGAGPGNQPWG